MFPKRIKNYLEEKSFDRVSDFISRLRCPLWSLNAGFNDSIPEFSQKNISMKDSWKLKFGKNS